MQLLTRAVSRCQGFWKDHLRGKPYHISALYVVDLAAFRAQAAGDQLRILYDSLSKDPNSLANLDQDLPNYAQHQVRIHSLPQEWLWCESWCGNATKAAAKPAVDDEWAWALDGSKGAGAGRCARRRRKNT